MVESERNRLSESRIPSRKWLPFYERFGIPRSEPYQPPGCGDTLEQLIEQDERHAADTATADVSGDGASVD